MATPESPSELQADPAALREAAEHLRQRPGPLDLTSLDPVAAGAAATAAAVAAFFRSYHAVAAALGADDDAAVTRLDDVAEHYRSGDTFRTHT